MLKMRGAARVVAAAVRRQMSQGAGSTSSGGAKVGAFAAAAAFGGGGLAFAMSQSPAHAESASGAPLEETITEKALRMVGLSSVVDFVVEPAERPGCPKGKLLPNQELPPGVTHRTLVLSLEECLVYTDWERARGHRTMKRPGLDSFLAHMSQFYEIVIFTKAQGSYAQPIAEALQNQAYVQHSLYREHCTFTGGKYVKDLGALNRDLRNVIIIDTNPDQYSLQPHNAIHVNEWHGDLDDTRLLELVPFLEAVFKEDIPDVRDVLSVWPADSVPEKFRELKRQVAERKKRGGNVLLAGQGGRRGTPGVLPVLSTMVPVKRPELHLPVLAKAEEAKEKKETPKESKEEPAKPVNAKKALFDKVKAM